MAGILLGSGTEDYFDSGSYFNAGEFRLPVAGDTHLKMKGAPWWGINTSANVSEWSACEHLLFKLLVPSDSETEAFAQTDSTRWTRYGFPTACV